MTIVNTVPNIFAPLTTIKSAEVNADFASIVADVNANAYALTDAVIYSGGLTTGSSNAYVTADPSPNGFSLAPGKTIIFIPSFTNTSTATLNVSSTGDVDIKKSTDSGPQDLASGDIVAGNAYMVTYTGTFWQLLNATSTGTSAGALFTSVHPVSITITGTASSGTASISAVGALATVIYQGTETDTDSASEAYMRVDLQNSTTVRARRGATFGGAVSSTVKAVVVEWNPDYVNKVESGSITISGAAFNTATLSSSFNSVTTAVIYQGHSEDGGAIGWTHYPLLSLTSPTEVTATRNASGSATTVNYTAIEFNAALLENNVVQYAVVDLAGATTANATIASITTSAAFLLFAGIKTNATSINSGCAQIPRIYLAGATTVTATRSVSSTICQIGAWVIPLVSGLNSIQRSTGVAFGSSSNATTTTISSVTTANAFVNYLGQSSSVTTSSSSVFSDVVLTNATTVTQNRGAHTANTTTVSFEVIEST